MKKVYICGLVASGKGVLRALLDGHSRIINYPFDIGANLLKDDFVAYCYHCGLRRTDHALSDEYLRNTICFSIAIDGEEVWLTIGQLFVYLLSTDDKYQDIFDVSFSGKLGGSSVDGQTCLVDYPFNVIAFLECFAREVLRQRHFSAVEELQELLYDSVIKNAKVMSLKVAEGGILVQSSYTGLEIIRNILSRNAESQIIVAVRDPIGLCYANWRRSIQKGRQSYLLNTKQWKTIFWEVFNDRFTRKVKEFDQAVEALSRAESRVCLVQMEDVIEDTANTMARLAGFLEIEHDAIINTPTVSGLSNPILQAQIGSVYDKPSEVFSDLHIQFLRHIFYGTKGETIKIRCQIRLLLFMRLVVAGMQKIKIDSLITR